MKVVTIIGTRPQFIKAVTISNEFQKQSVNEVIIHTGQHYDHNMSDNFFHELNLPKPKYCLQTGNLSSCQMLGRMIIELEPILKLEQPDYVIVYGDCNTTLAGALASNKLAIPVVHIEAGVRSGDLQMPEEMNRILVDRIATIHFCPTEKALEHLQKEIGTDDIGTKDIGTKDIGTKDIGTKDIGTKDIGTKNVENQRSFVVGDSMMDLLRSQKHRADEQLTQTLEKYQVVKNQFYLLTLHRVSNTLEASTLNKLLNKLDKLNMPILFPIHPRTKKLLQDGINNNNGEKDNKNIVMIDPVGYLEMITLIVGCCKVLTDSGGLQKEAYELNRLCITLRNTTEWTETIDNGWNILVEPDNPDLISLIENFVTPCGCCGCCGCSGCSEKPMIFKEHASKNIVERIRANNLV